MPKIRHKYNSVKTELDGITFDSKLEASYYIYLKQLKMAGKVLFFLRQVPFHLPGKVTYRVDFQVFTATGSVHFIDVKGMETAGFLLKKKQVEELYAPVEIEIKKKGDF
jgi:hypothetical protein